MSWKEIWAGTARAMQQTCSEYKTIPILEHGLTWLDSIKKYEMQLCYARNPHELARVLECETRITCSEVFLKACIAKIEAEEKGIDKDTYVFNQLVDDKVVTTYKEHDYWLKGPNKSSYLENYKNCRAAEKEAE
ncbi:MAG: hypothetical protein HGA22_13045 [Clostridiales bacterium]|nr:hypothetical protein [Clostridiales bacterium]